MTSKRQSINSCEFLKKVGWVMYTVPFELSDKKFKIKVTKLCQNLKFQKIK